WHGVFSEYTFSTLGFYCDGADLVRQKYENLGVDAKVLLVIEYRCDPYSPWQTFFEGNLLVSNLRMTEGMRAVECTVEESGTAMMLRNRYEIPVDLLSDLSLDGETPVTPFTNGVFPAKIKSNESGALIRRFYRAILRAGCIVDTIGRNHGLFDPDNPDEIRFGQNGSPCYISPSMLPSFSFNDIVNFQGDLYRCVAPTSTAGAFVPSEWQLLPYDEVNALRYSAEHFLAKVHAAQPGASVLTVQDLIDNGCMMFDAAGVIQEGIDPAFLEIFGRVFFTAAQTLNEFPGTQPQGVGLVQVYGQEVDDDLPNHWDLNDCGSNDFDGTQSDGEPIYLFVAPEAGEYTVRLSCQLELDFVVGAYTRKDLVFGGNDFGANNFEEADLALIYNNGAGDVVLAAWNLSRNPPPNSNGVGANAHVVNGLVWNININETIAMAPGQGIQLRLVLIMRGNYRRSLLGDNYLHALGLVRVRAQGCCFEVFQDFGFQAQNDPDIAVFAPYEVFNRVVDSITEGFATVRSTLLSRPDAQPHPQPVYGCASLATLTNGYFIRGYMYAGASGPAPPGLCGGEDQGDDENIYLRRIYMSLKQLFDAFDAVFCIGMGVEDGGQTVRVESRRYFYQDTVVLTVPARDLTRIGATREVDGRRIYNVFSSGYAVWESESVNGLNEFNTRRTWYLPVSSYKNELKKQCEFIASGYTFEVTRRQNIVVTGSTDFKYDENIFFVQLKELQSAVVGYSTVERGIGPVTANVLASDDAMNWRLRPSVMARRWLPWLAQSMFHTPFVPDWLRLASGSANIDAQGSDQIHPYLPAVCNFGQTVEKHPLSAADAPEPPFLRPEIVSFKCRLSVAEYLLVKANPYGLIRLDFGGSNVIDGWIFSMEYKINDFEATFQIMPKL
ncbi:MAG: hypothetical protein NZ534_05990, partial [Bacteroidia bacterium]|nr:hypothetical protein [Bacteroidia bacterium]